MRGLLLLTAISFFFMSYSSTFDELLTATATASVRELEKKRRLRSINIHFYSSCVSLVKPGSACLDEDLLVGCSELTGFAMTGFATDSTGVSDR